MGRDGSAPAQVLRGGDCSWAELAVLPEGEAPHLLLFSQGARVDSILRYLDNALPFSAKVGGRPLLVYVKAPCGPCAATTSAQPAGPTGRSQCQAALSRRNALSSGPT